MKKVLVLAGGVGGAKLVKGLANIVPHKKLTVVVNTGDDFIHYGLNISPDLDTVMYSLAGLSNETTGWGRKNETWNCQEGLKKLGSETWFNLGDYDLATNLERTRLLKNGMTLTDVTTRLCQKLGIKVNLLPMTDGMVSTYITTDQYGDISFQEYFVKYKFEPVLKDYKFVGIEKCKLNPKTKQSIMEADIVIIGPSNPWLSIMPILAVEDTKQIIMKKVCVAVSPIVGNTAIKGPAAKIFKEMGITPSATEVARLYKDMLKGFVIDELNAVESETIRGWGIIPLVTDTVMKDDASKERLAGKVFEFASQLAKGI